MPVSNHDKMIATTKSGHIALAFPATDTCWDASYETIVPGDNYIDTAHLGSGKTTKTFIHDANVWTAAGLIDAAPSDPAHAGVGGGLASGTYRKEAAPTSYSQDVKFEGNGVVRTMDSTTQNHANTKGLVDGGNVNGKVDNAADYLKKKCTIDTLVGQCGHGRKLGAPPNAKADEAFFLDVLGGDTVTLTTTRKDLTANAPAACAAHTAWLAQRTGITSVPYELRGVGDTFVVSGIVMMDPWTGGGLPLPTLDAPKDPDAQRYADQKKAAQKRANKTGDDFIGTSTSSGTANFQSQTMPPAPGGGQPVAANRAAQYDAYNKKLGTYVDDRAKQAFIQDIAKAIAFWMIEREPPVVNVTALACGGAKHVVLRVFPSSALDFDLFTEALNAKFKLIKDLSAIVELISAKFGISASVKFLDSPNFKLSVEYKELTEDKNTFVKTQVRKSWSLTFSFDPFFEAGVKFTAPILPLVANFGTPALAAAVKWLMDKAGVALNFFAEIKLSINPNIKAVYDEYDDGYVTGPMCKLDVVFSIGFEVKLSAWGLAEARLYADFTLQLEKWLKAPKPALVQADLTGYIQIGFKGFAKASFWGWDVVNVSWDVPIRRFPPLDANGGGGSTKITTFVLGVR